ncbi:MAG: hypothetical protein KF883_02590 [Thermomicrobiales bacterium]|nr:hypothetical protein [Thermomicrobiales bacterium]
MERESQPPAVERQYEGPRPSEQRAWNRSIYGTVLLLAVVFALIVLTAILIF